MCISFNIDLRYQDEYALRLAKLAIDTMTLNHVFVKVEVISHQKKVKRGRKRGMGERSFLVL